MSLSSKEAASHPGLERPGGKRIPVLIKSISSKSELAKRCRVGPDLSPASETSRTLGLVLAPRKSAKAGRRK